jgi:hypothetical protein
MAPNIIERRFRLYGVVLLTLDVPVYLCFIICARRAQGQEILC